MTRSIRWTALGFVAAFALILALVILYRPGARDSGLAEAPAQPKVRAAGLECSSGRATADGVIRTLTDCAPAKGGSAGLGARSADTRLVSMASTDERAALPALGADGKDSEDSDDEASATARAETALKNPQAVARANSVIAQLEDHLGVDSRTSKLDLTTVRDSAGASHVWYEQRYKGLRVHGALVGVHLAKKSDKLSLFDNGAVSGIALASTRPRMEKADAQSVATAQAGKATGRRAASGELVILPTPGSGGSLAWRFDVSSKKPYGHWEVFIDDASGQPLETNDLLLGVGEEFYEYGVPFRVTLPSVQDADIGESEQNSSTGDAFDLRTGRATGDRYRALQQFDLGPLFTAFGGATPDISSVRNATLYSYVSSDSAADRTLSVHELTSAWDEDEAAWTTRDAGGVTWDPGATFNPVAVSSKELLSTLQGWASWNVTALLDDWLGGTDNNGILLKDSVEGTAGGNSFLIDSKDDPEGNPAFIDVVYTVPAMISLGRVFEPNPIVSSGFKSLADNNDADSPALNNQRDITTVKGLRRCIDTSTGKISLYGIYVNTYVGGSSRLCIEGGIEVPTSEAQEKVLTFDDAGHLIPPSGDPLQCPTGECFGYLRSDPRFEEVNAYVHINSSRERLSSLGFLDIVSGGSSLRDYQMQVEVNSSDPSSTLNAFFDPAYNCGQPVGIIRFGDEGVDMAEDADVINHEYGHAILASQMALTNTPPYEPFCGSEFVPYPLQGEEGRAIHEGFSDYWAYSMHLPYSAGPYGHECIGAWAARNYGSDPCMREIDDEYSYPGEIVHEEHDDGRIWSRALYDMNRSFGRDVADKLIVESHYYYNPRQTFAEAAMALVLADRSLYPSESGSGLGDHEARILQVMANRGIYPTPSAFSALNSGTSLPTGSAGEAIDLTWWNGGSSTPKIQVQYTPDALQVGTFAEGFEDGRIAPYEWRGVALTDSTGHDSDLVLAGPTPIDWDLRDPAWSATAKWASEGRFSARSAQVGNGTSSKLHATVYLTDPGSISFDYRVASEKRTTKKRGDGLFFSACGPGGCIKRGNWTGTKEGSVSISSLARGWWVFEWKYVKDGSDPASSKTGADGAYVDDVRISGVVAPEWTDVDTLQPAGTEAMTWSGPSQAGKHLFRARSLAGSTFSPWSYSNEYEVP